MAFSSLLQTLQDMAAAFPNAQCDGAPQRKPQLVEMGSGLVGNAARMQLTLGKPQQTVWLPREYGPALITPKLFVAGRWRFPKGANRTSNSSNPKDAWGHEHKMLIVDNVGTNPGRVLLGTRGGGTTPPISIYIERCDPYGTWHASSGGGLGIDIDSNVTWPDDGEWHVLSALIERTGSGNDRVQVWLDNRVAIDVRGRTSAENAPPIPRICWGAFYNQAAGFDHFDVAQPTQDDHVVSLDAAVVTPPPPPPVLPTLDLQDLLRKLDDLARRGVDAATDFDALRQVLEQMAANAADLAQRSADNRDDLTKLANLVRAALPK